MKRFTTIALCALCCVFLCFAVGCTPSTPAKTEETPKSEQSEQATPKPDQDKQLSLEEATKNTVKATITMQDGGIIVLELYPDLAPQSVRNFVSLAQLGFYDGLTFHRIMSGFMIQGGDPQGTGTGGPGYSIKGEFASNGFTNDLSHKRGVLSMARSQMPDSAGSQFFIMHADSDFLDGEYAAFGKVVEGMDVVDKIAAIPNSGENGAVADANKPVIASITVDASVKLPEPDKIK